MAPSRAQRRELILDELVVLIEGMLVSGESFSEISVERLAGAAGMSRTRFYLYFEDKNDVLLAWFGRIRARLVAEGGRWWCDEPPESREALAGRVERMLRAYRPHAPLMAAVEEVAALSSTVRGEVEAAMRADSEALREHIALVRAHDAAVERGVRTADGASSGWRMGAGLDVDPEPDADAVARWLAVMTWRGRSHLPRGSDAAELIRAADGFAGLVWNLLYARSSVAPGAS